MAYNKCDTFSMLNLQLLGEAHAYFNSKRFLGEDQDFVLKVASKQGGHNLKVIRIENQAIAYKRIPSQEKLRNFEVKEDNDDLEVVMSVSNYSAKQDSRTP